MNPPKSQRAQYSQAIKEIVALLKVLLKLGMKAIDFPDSFTDDDKRQAFDDKVRGLRDTLKRLRQEKKDLQP